MQQCALGLALLLLLLAFRTLTVGRDPGTSLSKEPANCHVAGPCPACCSLLCFHVAALT
jgi:hypothetical protein